MDGFGSLVGPRPTKFHRLMAATCSPKRSCRITMRISSKSTRESNVTWGRHLQGITWLIWYLMGYTMDTSIPVVPHKAVAEVSKIGHYRRGELL